MSKHTAGPWVIIPGGDEWSQGRIATIEPKQETMIEINYWTVAEVNNRREEREANARLISAAPDLLESLESLFEIGDVFGSAIEHKDPHCQSFDEWSDKARAAIAKARGEA